MLTNQETLLGRGTLVGAFPGGSVVKNPPANAGDVGLIPGSGRSAGGGNGNPLQDSCLENPVDGVAWGLQSMGPQESDTDRGAWIEELGGLQSGHRVGHG